MNTHSLEGHTAVRRLPEQAAGPALPATSIGPVARWSSYRKYAQFSGDLMTDRSDVTALEHMLNYATEEAQRLRVPTLVVRCLRIAVHELTQADTNAPTNWPTDFSVH